MTTPHNDLAPLRPHLAPASRGDVRNRPRPSPPSPTGGEVELRAIGQLPETTSTSPHGAKSIQDLHLIPTSSPAYPFARAYLTLRLAGQRLLDEANRQLMPIRAVLDSLTTDRSSETPRAGGHQ